MNKDPQKNNRMKGSNLWYMKEGLLNLIDDEVWSELPHWRAARQIIGYNTQGEEMIWNWYNEIKSKIVNADINLTKKYFPDVYKSNLCGYVDHKRRQ
ncbi:MAG: hypothetical protein NWF05_05370 [Candidatus Bathyarchaeota archaeon]|nr:hypothetical protein [Candidatus Bathyarchaeota archaeon]